MAVSAIADTLRNSFRDAVNTALANGDVLVRNGTTTLATISLGATPFTTGTGSLTLTSDKSATASAGSGTAPDNCQWRTSGAAVQFQSTAGVGSGDLSFNGTITSGQTVTLSSGIAINFPAS